MTMKDMPPNQAAPMNAPVALRSFGKSMRAAVKILLVCVPWVVLLCMGVSYCWSSIFSFPWVWEEKGRVPAPSASYELVTYEGSQGAMSSFAYVCFLVKRGGTVNPNSCDFYEPVLSSSHDAPAVRWESDHRLVIAPGSSYVNHQRPYSREFDVAIVVAEPQGRAVNSR